MTIYDVLKHIYELNQWVSEYLSVRVFFDFTIFFAVWLLSREVAHSNVKVVRYLIFGDKGLEIEIIDDSKDSMLMKHPLAASDVEDYLMKLYGLKSRSLRGIDQIFITNRPPNLSTNVLGSFTPHDGPKGGAVICIFPMGFNLIRQEYTLDFSEVGTVKIGYTEEEAKNLLLFTLGHEIGHNVRYRKDRNMFGDEVEEFCDKFSANLNIVPDPIEEKVGRMFHTDSPDKDLTPKSY